MRKWLLILVGLFLLISLGSYTYMNQSALMDSPWGKTVPFENVSKAAMDDQGNSYVIFTPDKDKKTRLMKIDAHGRIQYMIDEPVEKDGTIHLFNNLSVDRDGNLYVLNTSLYPFGLYVKKEQIDRYDADGRFDKTVYSKSFDETAQHKRIGEIRSDIFKTGQMIYFYKEMDGQLQLVEMDLDGANVQMSNLHGLPAIMPFLSEVASFEPRSLVYVNKKGYIYGWQPEGDVYPILPLDGEDPFSRTVPESVTIDNGGLIYYIDKANDVMVSVDRFNRSAVKNLGNPLGEGLVQIRAYDRHLLAISANQIGIIGYDGQVLATYQSGELSVRMQLKHWTAWGALLLLSAVLFLFVRFIYAAFMDRRISLIFKQIIIILPILIISMLFLAELIYNSFSDKLATEVDRELILLANNAKNVISGDKLQAIEGPRDYMNADYASLKSTLNKQFDDLSFFDREGLYNVLYKYVDGQLYIIYDDDDSVNPFTPFEVSEYNLPVVEKGEVLYDNYQDENGFWRYALGPVYNSEGKIVGIYETGKDMNGLLHQQHMMYRSVLFKMMLIVAAFTVVFILITYYLLYPLRTLRRSVNEVASGKWETAVEVKTRDEVGELGERFNDMSRHIRDYISKITIYSEAYFRFVPQSFLKYLGKSSILDVKLGDQVERNMTILVFEMHHFYAFSKKLTTFENFNFINSFLKRFGPFISNHGGVVNKYLGAGILALFPDSSEAALKAGIQVGNHLTVYNGHRANYHYEPLSLGIALHKGSLMLGIIGEEERFESNVISDQVNLTNLLMKATPTLGATLLVTEEVIKDLPRPEQFQMRNLGQVVLEDGGEAIVLYDVYEAEADHLRQLKHESKAWFEEAVVLYQVGRFYDAREMFLKVIRYNRYDLTAKLYFYICDEFYQKGTSEGWNGTLQVS